MKQQLSLTTDLADIKWIIWEHEEQPSICKFDNLGKMDQFLTKHKLLPFTQYKRDNLNSPVTMKEIEFAS